MLLSANAGYSMCLASPAVGVAVDCLLFTILCFSVGQAVKNSLLFLNAKPHSNFAKNCLYTSDRFECGKSVGFRQHLNLNSVSALIFFLHITNHHHHKSWRLDASLIIQFHFIPSCVE